MTVGTRGAGVWIPAFAGMTGKIRYNSQNFGSLRFARKMSFIPYFSYKILTSAPDRFPRNRSPVLRLFHPSFRQRCGFALTDPVTIGAVVLLLVNDLVLKQLWPDSWLTGKLSDFAWLVFACPLLAFLLSWLTGQRGFLERLAFVAAYAGLPLVYLVFNSSATVHDLILSGLLPLTGSAVGSPLDPWDSLVIPFSMSAALWVWFRSGGWTPRYRARFAFLAAVVALVATIATSPFPTSGTEWFVGIVPGHRLVMEIPDEGLYTSEDGGRSWNPASSRIDMSDSWGGQEVSTPRGTYALNEAGVWLFRPGADPELVFPAAFLTSRPAQWAQRYSRERLNPPINDDYRGRVATRPLNLVYHEPSGNVVVSLAAEGVVIGDPSSSWSRVGVGEFQPTDFSYFGLLRLLLAGPWFWFGAFSFAMLFTVAGLLFADRPATQLPTLLNRLLAALRWVALLAIVFMALSPALDTFPPGWAWAVVLLFLFVSLLLGSGDVFMRIAVATLAGMGALVSAYGFPPFSGTFVLIIDGPFLQASRILGLLLSLAALVAVLRNWQHRRAVVVALAAMVAVIVLVSAIWLGGRLSGVMALGVAVLLLVLLAGLLSEWVRRSSDGGIHSP